MSDEKKTRIRLGVSHQRPEQLTDDHLNNLKQMGVESLEVWIPKAQSSINDLIKIRRKVEGAGLELFEIMLVDLYNLPETTIDAPGRDDARAKAVKPDIRPLRATSSATFGRS